MRLSHRIYLPFLACMLAALALVTGGAAHIQFRRHGRQIEWSLKTLATVIASELATYDLDPERIDARCKEIGRLTGTHVTVILSDGRVIGDSDHDPIGMVEHHTRSEIAAAFRGEMGSSVRFSDTLRRMLMHLALPVRRGDESVAVVRASLPITTVREPLHRDYGHLVLIAMAVAALCALIAYYLAQQIGRPLEAMRQTAERLTADDWTARFPLPRLEELAVPVRAMNRMLDHLVGRLASIMRQRDEQQAVFASMAEGVLAVDGDGRIFEVNAAACRLLDLDPHQIRGRSLQEAIRHPELHAFMASACRTECPVEQEITVFGREERTFQLRGTALADSTGRTMGALVVFNDITRLKKLETMRRDFVANVSHELKTPLTALQGCLETLSGRELTTPGDAQRFLAMMTRQVARLRVIVEDLLSLSYLEHEAEQRCVALERVSIGDILGRAVQAFAKPAEEKAITIAIECPAGLEAPVHAALLEQAVDNLLDNAVKYSDVHTHVTVRAEVRANDLIIQVCDEGPGIDRKHLPRIFERFYRVDKARSRALGGTGLGLAIVKHIALAHGGSVSVESTPGRGSVFTIRLPLERI